MSSDQLQRYFARIEYDGSREPTQSTLAAVHRAHLLAIPYENLDIHLGRRLTQHARGRRFTRGPRWALVRADGQADCGAAMACA